MRRAEALRASERLFSSSALVLKCRTSTMETRCVRTSRCTTVPVSTPYFALEGTPWCARRWTLPRKVVLGISDEWPMTSQAEEAVRRHPGGQDPAAQPAFATLARERAAQDRGVRPVVLVVDIKPGRSPSTVAALSELVQPIPYTTGAGSLIGQDLFHVLLGSGGGLGFIVPGFVRFRIGRFFYAAAKAMVLSRH